ncbi:MAG: hypothetical protein O3B13_20460 [Planctomycetota bacterium]|nr:hypothetical protein [Planctomycetota bacterium]
MSHPQFAPGHVGWADTIFVMEKSTNAGLRLSLLTFFQARNSFASTFDDFSTLCAHPPEALKAIA